MQRQNRVALVMMIQTNFNVRTLYNLTVLLCSVLIIALVVGKGLGPEMLLLDRFHEGEMFANAMEYIGNGSTEQRGLPIHGLLDILPSLLTAKIWGTEHNFIPTYALLKALDFGSALLMVLIAARFASQMAHRRSWLLISLSLISPFVVGNRDFFLLLSLLQMVLIVQRSTEQRRLGALFLFGVTAALAVFYSYDRGIAGTASLGLATLYLAWFDRRFVYAIGAFVGTVFILHLSSDLFSIFWYLRNIQYLMASSPEWSYPWTYDIILYVSFAVLLNAIALFLLWSDRAAAFKNTDTMTLFILLALLSFFMLKIGTNRADISHIFMASWVPCLIVMMQGKNIQFSLRDLRVLGMVTFVFMLIILAILLGLRSNYSAFLLVFPLFLVAGMFDFKTQRWVQIITVASLIFTQITYGVVYIQKTIINGQYSWVSKVLSPPSNVQASPPSVIWAAEKIQDSGALCLFDMSNNGLINGLTLLPSCSRFSYPIYAASRYEGVLITDLAEADPPIIIYSSDYWSYTIDGRSMRDRYSTLDDYLRELFPIETCKGDYCIREKS